MADYRTVVETKGSLRAELPKWIQQSEAHVMVGCIHIRRPGRDSSVRGRFAVPLQAREVAEVGAWTSLVMLLAGGFVRTAKPIRGMFGTGSHERGCAPMRIS